MPQLLEQRIIDRLTCSFELQLSSQGRNSGTVEALNISLIGLGIRHNLGDGSLQAGQEVALGMPGQKDVKGTVRWADSQHAGVQFSHCLDHVWDSWVMKAMPAGPKPAFSARLSKN